MYTLEPKYRRIRGGELRGKTLAVLLRERESGPVGDGMIAAAFALDLLMVDPRELRQTLNRLAAEAKVQRIDPDDYVLYTRWIYQPQEEPCHG